MPYIEETRRPGAEFLPGNAGELTYAIQRLLKSYLDQHGSESYQIYSECLGALRGAELDLWDRKLRAYEVLKREQNGDVW